MYGPVANSVKHNQYCREVCDVYCLALGKLCHMASCTACLLQAGQQACQIEDDWRALSDAAALGAYA